MSFQSITLIFTLTAGSFAIHAQPKAVSVVNAASSAPALALNGSIAQGSTFVVYGTGLGPATIVYSSSYPLPTKLGGTSATVSVGGTTMNAILLYALGTQIAAILPSATPTGTGTITVSYNGQSSAPIPITVVLNNFGIYTVDQSGAGPGIFTFADYSLVTNGKAVNPGETLLVWGTGLGSVAGNEAAGPLPGNLSSVPLKLFVGSKQAVVTYQGRSGCCAGLDQVAFVVPAGLSGCSIPVAIQTGNVVSNFTTLAISPGGRTCSDAVNGSPATTPNSSAYRYGSLLLERVVSVVANSLTGAPVTKTNLGVASFIGVSGAPASGSSSTSATSASLQSVGACYVYRGSSAGTTTSTTTTPTPITYKYLNAGPSIQVSGSAGTWTLSPLPGSAFGGYSGSPPAGDYSGAGIYTFAGSGGTDVGAFSTSLNVPAALAWTNQPPSFIIDRSQPLTVNWIGGNPASVIGIIGSSTSNALDVNSYASFQCLARVSDGSFTVPTFVLQSLPPTASASSIALGQLLLFTTDSESTFTAPGLDFGIAGSSSGVGLSLNYK